MPILSDIPKNNITTSTFPPQFNLGRPGSRNKNKQVADLVSKNFVVFKQITTWKVILIYHISPVLRISPSSTNGSSLSTSSLFPSLYFLCYTCKFGNLLRNFIFFVLSLNSKSTQCILTSIWCVIKNRNYAIQLWIWIGMRMQMIWDNVLDRIGDNSFHLYVYGIFKFV